MQSGPTILFHDSSVINSLKIKLEIYGIKNKLLKQLVLMDDLDDEIDQIRGLILSEFFAKSIGGTVAAPGEVMVPSPKCACLTELSAG